MEIDASIRSEILDAIANGIFVVDADTRVLVWNRWMVEHSGIPADIAIGRLITDVFPEIIGTRFELAIKQALSHRLAGLISPSIHRALLPLYRRPEDRQNNVRIHQLINLTPVRLVSVPGCTVQVQDMTAAVMRERRLREQTAALGSSNDELQARLDEIEALQHRLDEMQKRDTLTGLYNRAHLNDVLESELSAARRVGKPLSVVLLDIDNLKILNDTYGQQAGDEVIKGVGSQLAGIAHPRAIACRHGGDDFMVVLPDTDVTAAAALANSWRQRCENSRYPFGDFSLQVTLTAGIAGYPKHGKSIQELAQCVDLAIYLAKHDGNNRTVVFDADGH